MPSNNVAAALLATRGFIPKKNQYECLENKFQQDKKRTVFFFLAKSSPFTIVKQKKKTEQNASLGFIFELSFHSVLLIFANWFKVDKKWSQLKKTGMVQKMTETLKKIPRSHIWNTSLISKKVIKLKNAQPYQHLRVYSGLDLKKKSIFWLIRAVHRSCN